MGYKGFGLANVRILYYAKTLRGAEFVWTLLYENKSNKMQLPESERHFNKPPIWVLQAVDARPVNIIWLDLLWKKVVSDAAWC